MKHLLTFFCLLILFSSEAQNWQSANGPLGADATAFFIDAQGRYWLGTGSSGGVYVSEDKGQTWQARNSGIGTAHISWIGQAKGTIFAEIFLPDSLYYGNANEPFGFFAFEPKAMRWQQVTDSAAVAHLSQLWKADVVARQPAQMGLPEWHAAEQGLGKESIINSFGRAGYRADNNAYPHITGFGGTNAFQLNQTFPADVYGLRGGNWFKNEAGKPVLLARSGAYTLDNNQFNPLGANGLLASDVALLAPNGRGQVYALANHQEVAVYSEGSWKWALRMKPGEAASHRFFEHSPRLNIDAQGNALFCQSGSIWEISPSGEAKLLQAKQKVEGAQAQKLAEEHGKYLLLEDGSLHLYFLNAARDADGALWAIAAIQGKDFTFASLLGKFAPNGQFELVPASNCTRYSFLAAQGQSVWLFAENYMKKLGAPDSMALVNVAHNEAKLAFAPDGRMAYFSQNSDQSEIIMTDGQRIMRYPVNNLPSISSIGFDGAGNLYAGTGYQFLPPGFCGSELEGKAQGLFRLEGITWTPVAGSPNPWVLSLATAPDGRLMVGTSGSAAYFLDAKPTAPAPFPFSFVQENGKEGAQDAQGNWIVPAQHSRISFLADAQCFVLADEDGESTRYHFVSRDGKSKLPVADAKTYYMKGNVLMVEVEGGKTALCHTKDLTIMHWATKAEVLDEAGILFRKDGLYGLMDTEGAMLVAPVHREVSRQYAAPKQLVFNGGGKSVVVGLQNNKPAVQNSNYEYLRTLSDQYFVGSKGAKKGLVDRNTLAERLPAVYDSLKQVGNFILAIQDGKMGLLNHHTLAWTLPLKYSALGEEGDFIFLKKDNERQYVYKFEAGNNTYDVVSRMGQTPLYKFKKGAKWGLLDTDRQELLLPANTDEIEPLETGGYDVLKIRQGNIWGLFSPNSKELTLPLAYQNIKYLAFNLYKVQENGLWGVFSILNDSIVLPTKWDDCYVFEEGTDLFPTYSDSEIGLPPTPSYFAVQQAGLWGLALAGTGELLHKPAFDSLSKELQGSELIATYKGGKMGLLHAKTFQEEASPSFDWIRPFDSEHLLGKKNGVLLFFAVHKQDEAHIANFGQDFPLLWQYDAQTSFSIGQQYAVQGNKLWIAGRDKVLAINSEGKEVVAVDMGSPKTLATSGQTVWAGNATQLLAIGSDGKVLAKHELADSLQGMPMLANDGKGSKALFAATPSQLLMFDQQGMRLQEKSINFVKNGQPFTVSDKGIVFTQEAQPESNGDCNDYILTAMDAAQAGMPSLWSQNLSDCLNPVASFMHATDSTLVLGSEHALALFDRNGQQMLGLDISQGHFMNVEMAFDAGAAMLYWAEVGRGQQGRVAATHLEGHTLDQAITDDWDTELEGNPAPKEAPLQESAFSAVFQVGNIKSSPFVGDLLGTGQAQAGFFTDEGLFVLVNDKGAIAGAFQLNETDIVGATLANLDADAYWELVLFDSHGKVWCYKTLSKVGK